jgi:hypothetical protein
LLLLLMQQQPLLLLLLLLLLNEVIVRWSKWLNKVKRTFTVRAQFQRRVSKRKWIS